MADNSFSKFVPGFDFLQGLVKNAGSALPSMGQWVVPTLDPEELERRIEELRTVQFWLDQNSRMLSTTIQALEVQRMTLSALKGMNVTVNEMQDALKVRPAAERAASPAPAAAAAPTPEAEAADASEAPARGVVDAMEWWNALTHQFTQIANQAMQAAAQAVPDVPNVSSPAKAAPATAPGRDTSSPAPQGGAANEASAKGPVAGKRVGPRAATKPASKA